MNPGPAPTLLDEWITNAAFWWFMLVAATTGAAWLLASFITTWRTQDAEQTPAPHAEPQPHTCQIGDCPRPPTTTYDRHPAGRIWVCDQHAARVQRWTGTPGRPAEQVYDVELAYIEDYANGEAS